MSTLHCSKYNEVSMFSLIALYFAHRRPLAEYAGEVRVPVKTAANDMAAIPMTRAA